MHSVVQHNNALKGRVLAREVVIAVGDGAENREEFDNLLADLTAPLNPVGTLEEMLVEKIALAFWRLRRAYMYQGAQGHMDIIYGQRLPLISQIASIWCFGSFLSLKVAFDSLHFS